jgi:tetratricopeptide (TPR) repeat protein
MLDIQLFGLNPTFHHLTNLLLHIANTVLFLLVLFRMTKGFWQSAFAAALFGLHPLHVESVAWIAERKDVLSTFFWFLTMGAYVRYVERPLLQRYIVLLACFALGLMAKPMLVTLPFVLLLLDYWPLGRFWQVVPPPKTPQEAAQRANRRKRADETAKHRPETVAQLADARADYRHEPRPIIFLFKEKTPLFVISVLSCMLTYMAQRKVVEAAASLPLGPRLENAVVTYCIYIGKMIWPDNLAVFYPHPGYWPLWSVAPAVLLFAAITAAVILAGRKFPYLPSGWFWYAGTLVPVIGIVQVGEQARADRYTYIPLVGLFVIAAWGVPELLKKWHWRKPALAALAAAVLSCLFTATWVQVGYWRNNISLCDHALSVTPPNGTILNNRGSAYVINGEYARAISDFDRSIALSPRYADSYYGRGVAYNGLREHDRAIADFNRAIEIDPQHVRAYNGKGFARGVIGDYAGAISDFSTALTIDPQFGDAYNNRGAVYNVLRKYDRAIADFDMAIRIDPQNTRAYHNRGIAYGTWLGDYGRAIADFDRALAINSRAADVWRSRGAAHGAAGDYDRAIADFSRAIEIDPGYAEAYYNRGMTYNHIGERTHALDDMKQAARLGNAPAAKFVGSLAQSR